MNILRSSLAAAALSLPSLGLAAEEGSISGHISTVGNQNALNAAEVSIPSLDLKAHTDRAGNFVLNHVPAGTYTLEISYVGLPSKTISVTVTAGGEVSVKEELGDADVTYLTSLVVEGEYAGQAKALNDQRSRNNITSILSSDLTGQFPDKTIADAVKRMPGITVETDTDTGGSEGRYVTIRGMSAAFNSVTVNGVRVAIANADDSISRQVPLDVISAKSADSIVITKSLRPDQDGDSIGGTVDIITHSADGLKGPRASVEAAVSFRNILQGYENYRFSNPGFEGAVSYGNVLTKDGKWAYQLSANGRGLTSQKQRVSTIGWDNIGTSSSPVFLMDALILQDFFDHLTNEGASVALDGKPTGNTNLHFNAAYNLRRTDRGRQRQVLWMGYQYDPDYPEDFPAYIDGTYTTKGDTVTSVSTTENRITREVREFHEDQANVNLSLVGDSTFGDLTWSYLVGFNRGQYKGDPNRDVWARFETAADSTNSYTIQQGNAYYPTFTTSYDRNDASLFGMRAFYLDTDVITDKELDVGTDLKLDTELAGRRGYWKAGVKGRFRERARDNTTRALYRDTDWTLTGYDGTSAGSLLADYRATSLVDGHYDYGFYIDPAKVRATAMQLLKDGILEERDDNAYNSQLYTYTANEDILAAYAMGEFKVAPKFTVTAGLRAERTSIKFKTVQETTIVDPQDSESTITELVPITPKHTYTNVMPGAQFRYDLKKNLVLRGAITRSIARPSFSDSNPRGSRDNVELTISRGNINLKPTTSTNFDLSLDLYHGRTGFASIGLFHKDLKNNIYSPGGIQEVIDGETYLVDEPRNAEGGHVTGVELAYERVLEFLPAPFDGLGVTANWTHAESKVYTGIAANPTAPLFDQVKDTVNAGIFYDKGRFRTRLSYLYRSGSNPTDYGVDANYAALNRILDSSSALDFTVSFRIAPQWTIYGEIQNILNTPGRAYNGDRSLRMDYNEFTEWNGQVGVRWNL